MATRHRLSPHFTVEEFDCHDGSKVMKRDYQGLEFLCRTYLEPMRTKYGRVTILSGYRTRSHNARIGGASNELPRLHDARRQRPGGRHPLREGQPAPVALDAELATEEQARRPRRSRAVRELLPHRPARLPSGLARVSRPKIDPNWPERAIEKGRELMSDEELEEPKEEDLPPKPLGERLATDEELEAEEEPGEEEVPEEEILPPESAAMDDTVDDQEDDAPA